MSIYCLHTTLTHDLHIFSPIPGVNGKLTQKLTHHLHIFLFLLCQLTNYTIIDTLLTHFPLILVSIYWLHTKLTHDWHILPGFLVSMGSLHKNWHISYTFSFHCRVNLLFTQKLTHYWHIFYWILCQLPDYTQKWHIAYTFFPDYWCQWEAYTKIDSFLTRFWDSLPLASIFQNVSRCVKYVKCVSCVNHQADTSIDTADTCVNNVSVFHTWCLTVNLGTGSSKNRKSILTVCVTRQKSGSTDARS